MLIIVNLHQKKGKEDSKSKFFYFKKEYRIQQCKNEICEEFGIIGEDQKNFTLYKQDAFGEPSDPIRRENAGFEKNNVQDGDLLYLKNSKDMSIDEKMAVSISVTTSGIPEDCLFLQFVDVSKEFKLNDLKEQILTIPYFQGKDIANECIRIREKRNNMYFGKVFKDNVQ